MTTPCYPAGSVRSLLKTDHVSPATRAALRARLDAPPVDEPRFFVAAEFATLRAVCARLIPQDGLERPVDLAGSIDTRLADGGGDGWRYDALPPDGKAYRAGLAALEAVVRSGHGAGFEGLDGAAQDALLGAVQRGEIAGWSGPPPDRWFEEVLAEVAEAFYAHPLAQEEIGYAGMADRPGWTGIGLDEREEREPLAVATGGADRG